MKQYRADLDYQLRLNNKNDLLDGGRVAAADESNESLMAHGLSTQAASKDSLARSLQATAAAQEIGRETAIKMEEQKKQLEKAHDDLVQIDSSVARSKKIISRMARKLTTDKLIWAAMFLVIATIIFIIVWKMKHPEVKVNVPPQIKVGDFKK